MEFKDDEQSAERAARAWEALDSVLPQGAWAALPPDEQPEALARETAIYVHASMWSTGLSPTQAWIWTASLASLQMARIAAAAGPDQAADAKLSSQQRLAAALLQSIETNAAASPAALYSAIRHPNTTIANHIRIALPKSIQAWASTSKRLFPDGDPLGAASSWAARQTGPAAPFLNGQELPSRYDASAPYYAQRFSGLLETLGPPQGGMAPRAPAIGPNLPPFKADWHRTLKTIIGLREKTTGGGDGPSESAACSLLIAMAWSRAAGCFPEEPLAREESLALGAIREAVAMNPALDLSPAFEEISKLIAGGGQHATWWQSIAPGLAPRVFDANLLLASACLISPNPSNLAALAEAPLSAAKAILLGQPAMAAAAPLDILRPEDFPHWSDAARFALSLIESIIGGIQRHGCGSSGIPPGLGALRAPLCALRDFAKTDSRAAKALQSASHGMDLVRMAKIPFTSPAGNHSFSHVARELGMGAEPAVSTFLAAAPNLRQFPLPLAEQAPLADALEASGVLGMIALLELQELRMDADQSRPPLAKRAPLRM